MELKAKKETSASSGFKGKESSAEMCPQSPKKKKEKKEEGGGRNLGDVRLIRKNFEM